MVLAPTDQPSSPLQSGASPVNANAGTTGREAFIAGDGRREENWTTSLSQPLQASRFEAHDLVRLCVLRAAKFGAVIDGGRAGNASGFLHAQSRRRRSADHASKL